MSATRPTPLAGTVLREARLVAGLSQSELARRAGVTQSVISTYESGGRDPSLTTLARLVAATGQRLSVVVEPGPEGAHQGIPDTRLGRRLRRRRAALMAAAQRRGATNLRVFGSVARGEDGPDSDVDLLVDLAPGGGCSLWPVSSASWPRFSASRSTSRRSTASSPGFATAPSERRSRCEPPPAGHPGYGSSRSSNGLR
ncbi:XRE family transcriptional regulator [Arsenicicoccus piscis]|uniref:HTH cro/C1-type domain-containing protein n=1 Tax=Arsenicicoccus piscis TaxID=673954 RepID=A0ABQ6HJ91_9MICO|nr:XRE family transcriptional regulator [Arsenicicoccus piscis]GMA18262.1 hypothetical protein GCM10025862_02830 [Arsenicicoccus piscis]